MPTIDVTAALRNPRTLTTFTVLRRVAVTGINGVTAVSEQTIPNVTGVLYPEGDNKLDRRPEAQSTAKSISIISIFRLHTAAVGREPDRVLWNGDIYEALSFEDYSQYGPGFTKVYLTAVRPAQQPVEAA